MNVMQQNLFRENSPTVSEKQFQLIALSESGILRTYENKALGELTYHLWKAPHKGIPIQNHFIQQLWK